jgi:hypothetical protein
MESEYVAMSMAMKDLIPLQRIVIEVCKCLNLNPTKVATIKSSVWEDNAGALTLARLEPPRMTPRSKHHSIKYHCFKEFVTKENISLNKIDTKLQLADILTKSLPKEQFSKLRKMLMGW